MMGKSYKASGGDRAEKNEAVGVIKKMAGVMLFVLAAAFGSVLGSMPTWAAFGTVFAYISVQAGIWIL